MNIGVDIRCLMEKNRTGVGEYTYGLLNAVFSIDKNNQYYLFYNSNKDISANIPKWEQENVHYLDTRLSNKLLNLLMWLKILALDKMLISKFQNFKILKFDFWFSPNLNFTHLSKNVKHIQTIHDLSFKFFPECFTLKQRLWHWFLNPRRQCEQANMILTPSENTKCDMAERFKIEDSRLKILQPGLLFNKEREISSVEQVKVKYNLPEKYVLYLGTLEPRKNVEAIITSYKLSNINYQLVIVGNNGWKNKRLLELIRNTPRVKYIGYVPEEDKEGFYKNASLFVFPSLYEGFGLPVLEATRYEVPVITSHRSSLLEIEGDEIYYVDPNNVEKMALLMKRILEKPKHGTFSVDNNLTWEKSARSFIDELKD